MQDFSEFWPDYVRQHTDPRNRALHVAGTLAVLLAAVGALSWSARLWFLVPLLGYGPAWLGHLLVEGNRPATFSHPLWSLRGDMKMLALTLSGRMKAEVAAHRQVGRANKETTGRDGCVPR
jgi:hypothetical protein